MHTSLHGGACNKSKFSNSLSESCFPQCVVFLFNDEPWETTGTNDKAPQCLNILLWFGKCTKIWRFILTLSFLIIFSASSVTRGGTTVAFFAWSRLIFSSQGNSLDLLMTSWYTTQQVPYHIIYHAQVKLIWLVSIPHLTNTTHYVYNIPYYTQPYQTTSHHTIPNHDKQGKVTPHHTQFPFKCSSYLTLIILDTNNGKYISKFS